MAILSTSLPHSHRTFTNLRVFSEFQIQALRHSSQRHSPLNWMGGGDRGRVAIYRLFEEFRRAKSHCHLYGAQGQRQVYLLPMPRCFVGLDLTTSDSCQVIYSQFGLAIHQNDHQARRRFVEWAQNEIAVVTDFQKRILFSDEAHIWLNGYVNKQNCRIWSEANPQVYVETPLHPEKLTVWCTLWAGGILLQKR
ncbi:transposase [Trichonephila clavipes]|nr:transposase [Trichonephila clavipes]